MKKDLQRLLIFDTETTGLPPKGAHYETDFEEFPHLVQLAWTMDGKEKDFIIKPEDYDIPEESTLIHGISHERAMDEGHPVKEVLEEFIKDCAEAYLLVGHNIYFDTSTIKANILRLLDNDFYLYADGALDKNKRIDTMMKTIKFVGAKSPDSNRVKFPKLEELYFKLFEGEFKSHNAMEDVRAVQRCLPELVGLGLIELKAKDEIFK